MAFKVKYEDEQLRTKIDAIKRAGGNPDVWLRRISEWQLASVQKNWEAQGKRYMSGGWEKLKPMTLALREWAVRKGISKAGGYTEKILEVSGTLKGVNSWTYQLGGTGAARYALVGTPVRYADRHQKGGTFPKPSFVKWKKKSTVRIPQRTLIAIAPDDMAWARKLADDYLKELHEGKA